MRLHRAPRRHQEVDMAPLIDMVFILLIFFAVSTTFTKDMQLELQRPSARSAAPASSKAVRVHVDRGRQVFVDEQPVKPWMLQARVRDLLAASATKKALVVADRLVPAELLVEVVDQCRLAGASEVGVATEAGAP
ncbi:MAG: biopolymer transporter ExbD [Planctomycetes bacterium]|nr:biopolymer transporter ExbD [Planctomycetota bacterium]